MGGWAAGGLQAAAWPIVQGWHVGAAALAAGLAGADCRLSPHSPHTCLQKATGDPNQKQTLQLCEGIVAECNKRLQVGGRVGWWLDG